jgi:hypothetical protein
MESFGEPIVVGLESRRLSQACGVDPLIESLAGFRGLPLYVSTGLGSPPVEEQRLSPTDGRLNFAGELPLDVGDMNAAFP